MSALVQRVYTQLQGDRMIWMIVALLSLFSLLAVYSSTGKLAYQYQHGNTEFYLMKHLVLLTFGWLLMYLCYRMHYLRYSKWAPSLLLISWILLFFTLAMGINLNEARRWIIIPVLNISFQTSDLAKIALIIYVARAISAKQEYIKDFQSAFLPIIIPILITCALIAPADLSSAMLLFFTCILMMFIGRVAIPYILLLLLLGIVLFAFLIIIGNFFPEMVRVETWISRIREFMSGDGFQIQQSKIAIAQGGLLFGVGPGNSVQRNYLPQSYSDFIYSIIIEEYGFLIAFLVLALYIILFLRTVKLVTNSPKAFGAMLAIGISLLLVLQALTNMAVAVHLIPVTGLTLPLISLGGTSLLFTCISLGMLLSVSRYIERIDVPT